MQNRKPHQTEISRNEQNCDNRHECSAGAQSVYKFIINNVAKNLKNYDNNFQFPGSMALSHSGMSEVVSHCLPQRQFWVSNLSTVAVQRLE